MGDLGACPLLQIPHVTGPMIRSLLEAKQPVPDLKDLLDGSAREEFIKKLKLNEQQALDWHEFCNHVPRMEVSATVEVIDEEMIAEGDMATVTITLTRANLRENEAMGPVHAPYLMQPKFEEWWVMVYDEKSRRLITADVLQGTERTETLKMRMGIPRYGEFKWKVYALCDSYLGLDVECEANFTVYRRSQVDRSIFIHPADKNIKSFFEELMEGLDPNAEDSEESEDEAAAAEAKSKASSVAVAAAKKEDSSSSSSSSGSSDSEDEEKKKKRLAKKVQQKKKQQAAAKPKAAKDDNPFAGMYGDEKTVKERQRVAKEKRNAEEVEKKKEEAAKAEEE